MQILSHLILGFTMSGIGIAIPGLINMTATSVCIKRGWSSAIQFNLGAASIIFLQAFVAVTFSGYFANHPEVFHSLKWIAISVLLTLSLTFLYLALNRKAPKRREVRGQNWLAGVGTAFMNVLTVPYFFAFSTYMRAEGYLSLTPAFSWVFITGAALGALTLLTSYAWFGRQLAHRLEDATPSINFFLSGLFFVLAVVHGVELMVSS